MSVPVSSVLPPPSATDAVPENENELRATSSVASMRPRMTPSRLETVPVEIVATTPMTDSVPEATIVQFAASV